MNIEQAIQSIGILKLVKASKEAMDYENRQEAARHEARIKQYCLSYGVNRDAAEAELGKEGHKISMKRGLDIALAEISPRKLVKLPRGGGWDYAPGPEHIKVLQDALERDWPALQAALNAAYKAAKGA